MIKIISCHSIFNENAVILSKKFGWTLENEFDPQAGDIYVVFGSHEMSHQLLEIQLRKNASFGYIIMNSEQIESQFFKNKYYIELMKRNIVFDFNTLSAEYLKTTHKIKVLSYFFFEFMKYQTEEDKREYDVCFIGSKNQDRIQIMDNLKKEFPELNFYVDMEWSHKSSESLTKILHKCKVVLNVGNYKADRTLETHRINKALACGCDVISMYCDDDDANQFYKNYCYITGDFKTTIRQYFNHALDKKKPYEELVKELSQKFNPHMMFVVNNLQDKLKSLHNTDETSSEIVSKQTSTDRDLSADTKEEIQVGEQV
jgi:hypothetical protein